MSIQDKLENVGELDKVRVIWQAPDGTEENEVGRIIPPPHSVPNGIAIVRFRQPGKADKMIQPSWIKDIDLLS